MDIDQLLVWVKQHKILATILTIVVVAILFVMFLLSSTNSARFSQKNGYDNTSSFMPGVLPEISRSKTDSLSYEKPNPASPIERKIIQSGDLYINVNNIDQSLKQIKLIAQNYKGFTESSNINEAESGYKSGSIVIRVPSEKFNDAMDEIKKVAEKVDSESIETTDVTAQHIDLLANLKNYKSEEEQYLVIMKSASSVEDILNVQQRLSEVRGKIESTEAQLEYLNRQTDMSDIYVNLTAEPDVKIFGVSWKPLNTLKIEFRNFLVDMKNLYEGFVEFAFALPGLIIRFFFYVALIVVLLKILVLIYKKFLAKKVIIPNKEIK